MKFLLVQKAYFQELLVLGGVDSPHYQLSAGFLPTVGDSSKQLHKKTSKPPKLGLQMRKVVMSCAYGIFVMEKTYQPVDF